MQAQENYGIINSRQISGFLGRTLTAAIHIDQDGNGTVSNMEKLGLAQSAGFDAFNTFIALDYNDLGLEVGDLSPSEIMQLVVDYSENQQLKDPVLEGIIEDILKWIAQAPNFVERVKDWKALKAQTTEFKSIKEIAPNLLPVRFTK